MARRTSQKSAEIERFKQVLSELKETPGTVEEKTGISARTINNYIWGDSPIGGQLLRVLAEQFGVSVDWLLTGRGEMFFSPRQAKETQAFLLPFYDTVDMRTLQDFWWLAARCAEESLRQSGAVAGVDYGVLDLYQLAQPLVAAKFAEGGLILQAYEAAGK